MRVMVYGDSNSWGTPPDGSDTRFGKGIRWPTVMAAELGAILIEEALPGRTTVHDDPEMLGHVMNGLQHLPVALKSNSPLDLLLIMLGTNDFKARFRPAATRIAGNIGKLVTCARQVGGGVGPWSEAIPPRIAIIVPPTLSESVNNPDWDRRDEWRGGQKASLTLAKEMADLAEVIGVPVFDAEKVVSGTTEDPIHLDAKGHQTLGRAVARWLQTLPVSA